MLVTRWKLRSKLIQRWLSLKRVRESYYRARSYGLITTIPRSLCDLYTRADTLVIYYRTTDIEWEPVDSLEFKETLDIVGVKYE